MPQYGLICYALILVVDGTNYSSYILKPFTVSLRESSKFLTKFDPVKFDPEVSEIEGKILVVLNDYYQIIKDS